VKTATLLDEIEAFARERCAGLDSAHDALHVSRVLANARLLVHAEQAAGAEVDAFVVEAACWLHDVVQLPKGSGPSGESARQSAAVARAFLTERGVDHAAIDGITHAVEAHSYSGGMKPATIEAAILQDADRLDALGAVGIARLWVTGVGLGGTLHHDSDPAGVGRELDDRAYGLDHIERKLLRLPATMNTASGRSEAERRAEYVRQYRSEFLRELGVDGDSSAAPTRRARLRNMHDHATSETASLLERMIADGAIEAEMIEPGVPTPTVPDAAKALGVEERQIIKSLLFSAKSGDVVLAVLSGASRVNRQRLRDVSGLRGLEMAAPSVVLERTGYPAGGTPPVGHVNPLNVVVDAGIQDLPVVFGGGGRIDSLLRITPHEIVRVTNATLAPIAD
jgi:uncharacterized protein